jgi:hypothetical protein
MGNSSRCGVHKSAANAVAFRSWNIYLFDIAVTEAFEMLRIGAFFLRQSKSGGLTEGETNFLLMSGPEVIEV